MLASAGDGAGLTRGRRRVSISVVLLALLALLAGLSPGTVSATGREAAPVRQAGAASPAAFQVSLADLGFTADIVMRGARAGTRLGFPLPRQGIEGGRLILNLDVSPIVHPSASVQVTANGRPVSAFTVGQLREARTVEIALPPTEEPFLDVDMNGALFSATERCVQENDASLFMVLGRDSRLIVERSPAVASVADLLSLPGGIVAVQGRWDTPADQEASIALFGAIQHALRDRGSRVLLAEDAAGAPPTGQPRRDVVLVRESDPPLRLDGATLHVSPRREALDALAAESAQVLLTGPSVPSIERVASASSPIWRAAFGPVESYRRQLDTLGLGRGERVGTGVLSTPIRFTVGDLGGWPTDLMLDLDTHFDQVSTNTLERALLRVRLNGTLVETADLRGSSTFKRLIPLPASAIQPSNQLDVDFVYAPETGNCAGSPITFNGQISGGTGLVWSGYGSGRGTLPEVIGALDQTEIVLAEGSPDLARTAARLVGGLSRLAPRPVLPRLSATADLGQRRSGVTTIVLGGTAEWVAPLKLPVSVGAPVEIVDTRTNTQILRGSPDRPIVAAQYAPGASPALAIQAAPGANPALLDGAVRELVDPVRFFSWSGNVVLGVPGDMVGLDLTSGALQARQATLWDWRILLSRFRWVLAALAIVVVLVGCWLTYRRLGQPRAIPAVTEPSGA